MTQNTIPVDLQELTQQNGFFEFTLKGYNPKSDKTDNLIKWVSAPNRQVVDQFINNTNIQDLVVEVREPNWQGGKPDHDEFDIILNNNATPVKFHQAKSDWLLESAQALDI